jgi:uncharacterized protein (TIGR02145 family)
MKNSRFFKTCVNTGYIMLVIFFFGCSKNDNDTNIITDLNGNKYQVVTIGTQVWMAENLNVTKYRNGDYIEKINSYAGWSETNSGAYCNYDTDSYNSEIYGRLYNWYAIHDDRNVAPVGWHIPSQEEFQILINYLGGDSIAGGKLKETGTSHWLEPNDMATDESGFNALPGGVRSYDAIFSYIGENGSWWSSSETDTSSALLYYIWNTNKRLYKNSFGKKRGCSVRCIKD